MSVELVAEVSSLLLAAWTLLLLLLLLRDEADYRFGNNLFSDEAVVLRCLGNIGK